MKTLSWTMLILLGLSACAPKATQQFSRTNWDSITAGTKVAKVNNIKSLITPGFY